MTGPHCRHRSSPLLAAVALSAGLAGNADAQGSDATDRAALEVLYDATGGADWTDNTNWKTAAPLGEWYGVATDADGRVTELALDDNGLADAIPSELGNLADLRGLGLGSNDLTGPIPAELGNLVNLVSIGLYRKRVDRRDPERAGESSGP